MNWYHWYKEISRQADDLSDAIEKLAQDSKLPHAIWLVEEKKQRQLIDEICLRYAETNTWPENMNGTHIVLLYYRLVQASDRAEVLAKGVPVQNQSPAELDLERAEAVKLLLVDYWHSGGRARWLST